MEQAIQFIYSSGLTQEEKDIVGGILLSEGEALADRINLLHTDGSLKSLIKQKQPAGEL